MKIQTEIMNRYKKLNEKAPRKGAFFVPYCLVFHLLFKGGGCPVMGWSPTDGCLWGLFISFIGLTLLIVF